jgi:hypothetical protein
MVRSSQSECSGRWRVAITLLTPLALPLAVIACGGSGSTGLIVPESALLDEVRREGTCVAAAEVTYCATDSSEAVSSGGQSARAPVGDMAGAPTPCGPGEDGCPLDPGGFLVSGFDEGAGCASAARPAGSTEAWSIGPLVPVGGATTQVPVFYPEGLSPAAAEIALLCFEEAPAALPDRVESLADAAPDVVFVPPEP